jgi:TrmH family RNA methyltransferase
MADALIHRFRAARGDDTLTVLEGFHALKHALRFGAQVHAAVAVDPAAIRLLAAELAPDLADRLTQLVEPVDRSVLRELVAHAPHTEVVALARRPMPLIAHVLASDPRPVVLLEDPRHLGNVGAAIRVAAAADVAALITTGERDPWDPAALRGSAGLHYALPVARVNDVEPGGRPLIAIDPGGRPLQPRALPPDAILAFGTERDGLSPELLARADDRLALPMRTGVSSLNLATAVAGVLMSWRLA